MGEFGKIFKKMGIDKLVSRWSSLDVNKCSWCSLSEDGDFKRNETPSWSKIEGAKQVIEHVKKGKKAFKSNFGGRDDEYVVIEEVTSDRIKGKSFSFFGHKHNPGPHYHEFEIRLGKDKKGNDLVAIRRTPAKDWTELTDFMKFMSDSEKFSEWWDNVKDKLE